jgi:hypothetical protein
MNPPKPSSNASFWTTNQRWILLGLGCLAVGLVLVCVVAASAYFLFRPNFMALISPPVPTPACVEPRLTVGSASYRIETLARGADGSVNVPAEKPDAAYWIEGTSPHYILALSPTSDSLAAASALKPGDPIQIVWADCGEENYVVQSTEISQPNDPALFNPPPSGVTLFIQASQDSPVFVVQGVRPESLIPETPAPTAENEIQADITFLGDKISEDGKTVQIGVQILNRGSTPITLRNEDISLTPDVEGAQPIPLLGVEPALPVEIQPGAAGTFYLTFVKPDINIAVLRILDFSSDYYF